MSDVHLAWSGWGTFRLEPGHGPSVVVDPCISPLLDDPHAGPEDVVADVVLLTHGHHEHIRDAHLVAGLLPDAPLVAPPQVVEHLVSRRGVPAHRLTTIEPDQTVSLPGLRVTARSFPHLAKHDVAGKLGVLGRNGAGGAARILLRFGPRIVSSWFAIRGQPEGGPFLAYDLQWEAGPRAFLTCEAFTELLRDEVVAEWARGDQAIDLAVVGVESGQERAASTLTAAMGATHVVAAPVHAPFERFYGKDPVSPALFLAGAEGRDWSFWRPGDSRSFTSRP